MLPPRHNATTTALSAVFAWLVCIAPALAQTRSDAFKSYLNYLNYHRARIDGEHHPNQQTRKSFAEHADKLAPAVEKLEPEALYDSIKANGKERKRILTILESRNSPLAPQLLELEAELLALANLRDDTELAEEQKPKPETFAELESKIGWLQEHAAFLKQEIEAIAGKPSAADQAGGLYDSLLDLEEAKIAAGNLTDPEKKRRAQASAQIRSQRLRGKTLADARSKLNARQVTVAAQKLTAELKAIRARLSALANNHPEESARLTAMQEIYTRELAELKILHKKNRGQK